MINFTPEPGGRPAFDAFWRNLLVSDWDSSAGPMRFSSGLMAADLAHSSFFQNTRALLTALAEENGTAATATGNLNRTFVGRILERLALTTLERKTFREICKVLNEHDVWPLHLARAVAECGGLVVRRKKRFQLTKTGQAALPEDQIGALYRRVFLTYFRRFNLHYDNRLREVPGIQETMAVILWRLDTVAREWTPVKGLAPQVLLPGVLAQLHAAMRSEYDSEEWILIGYVLKPLFTLGLIQPKNQAEWPGITEHDEIRVSPLWRKFISFASFSPQVE